MIQHIVFSGGGADGIAYIGVVKALEEANIYSNLKHSAGTSIGSLFAFLVNIQLSSVKIKECLLNWAKTIASRYITMTSFLNVFQRLYCDDYTIIITLLDAYYTFAKISKDITFVQLAKRTGKTLTVCATCLNTNESTYFNVDNTPNIIVYDALIASMAIPMVFPPKIIQGKHYVDGSTTNSFPIEAFIHNMYHKEVVNIHSIYGFYLRNINSQITENPCKNFLSYFGTLLHIIHRNNILNIQHYSQLLPNFICLSTELELGLLPLVWDAKGCRLLLSEEKIESTINKTYETVKLKIVQT